MRHGNQKTPSKVSPRKPFSYRVPKNLVPSFADVVTVSRRTKASIIHESLEMNLPVMEVRYAPQLNRLRARHKVPASNHPRPRPPEPAVQFNRPQT